jgi:hypothetical protein
MGKKPDQGSGMNILDHFAESVETIFFCLKILEFFDADPGSFRPRIPDGKIVYKKPGPCTENEPKLCRY